jgi:transcriptional regulator with XRE-family HTH domain
MMAPNSAGIREDGLRELREIRLRRGLSQADLSAITGVTEFTISEIESGKRANPRPSTLRKLARALGVEVADFYGEANSPLGEAPSPQEKLFENGSKPEEPPSKFLLAWRAYVWDLVLRWQEDPPKTTAETATVLDAMTALKKNGAFDPANAASGTEKFHLQMVVKGLAVLNEIADSVEKDKRRQDTLQVIRESLSA